MLAAGITTGLIVLLLHSTVAKVVTDNEIEELKDLIDELTEDDVKRIIGGERVTNEDGHLWLVSLQAEIPTRTFLGITLSSTKLYCGGSLIKPKWVLTAAHCFVHNEIGVKARTGEYWTARLGTTKLESGFFDNVANFFGNIFGVESWRTWEISGKQIITHEGYDPNRHWLHDVALIELEESVPKSVVLVGEVTLPAQGDDLYPLPMNECVALGWGCTNSGGRVSDNAMKVGLRVLSDESCLRTWGVPMDTRICAGEPGKNKGICSGDSGGPLMCKRETKWFQAGIASFASAKDPGNYPGVFTQVSSYRNWIDAHSK